MWPMLTGLITGGASLVGDFFSANQSARNTSDNIAAQQASQVQSQNFNADQAGINRNFQADQAANAMGFTAGQHDISRNFNADQAQINRTFQADQVEANRQWQTQMSNSAHQRAAADMKAAGLNRILAAGSPAHTPSGGAASGSSASSSGASGSSGSGSSASSSPVNMAHFNTKSALSGLGDAVSKSVNSAIAAKTFDKMTDQIANIQADTAATKAREKLTDQQRSTEVQETTKRANESDISHYRVAGARLSSEEAKAIMSMPSWLRNTLVQAGYAGEKVDKSFSAIPGLASSAKSVRGLFPSRERVERHTNDTRGHGSSSFEERFRGGY